MSNSAIKEILVRFLLNSHYFDNVISPYYSIVFGEDMFISSSKMPNVTLIKEICILSSSKFSLLDNEFRFHHSIVFWGKT